MNSLGALAALLALAVPATPARSPSASTAPPPSTASLADRLSWNARERTAAGVKALAAKRAHDAIGDFDTALRLRPDQPLARYNAGTARLGVESRAAEPLLEQAAKAAPADLAPEAWYNLGNARLDAGDAKGAVQAYVESLRRRPDFAPAKYNLELALRRQEEKRREQQQKKSTENEKQQPGNRQGKPGQQRSGADHDQPDASSTPTSKDSEAAQREAQPKPSPSGRNGTQSPSGSASGQPSALRPGARPKHPLPRFHDLPDMTAQQAAAILRAVEDLERQHRRERAAQLASSRAREDDDW